MKALELFNEYTASAISNNRIAAEMGISSGNLHYHFKNKESVIREIYHLLFEKMDNIWYEPASYGSEEGLIDYFYKLSGLLYEYRFCYLELNVLLKNDPVLKDEYAARTGKILLQMEKLYNSYVDAGIMKSIGSEDDKRYIVENAWIVGLMWISYADMVYKKLNNEIIHESVRHIYYIIKPYMTPGSAKKVEERLFKGINH
jgi:AcrR family transcriptional regulator